MPRDSRWRSVSAPIDELEEWGQIARRDDPRLPDSFSALDSIRSIVKLYKKQRLRDAGTVRSADSKPVPDRTVSSPTPTTVAHPGDGEFRDWDKKDPDPRVQQKIELEKAKANTAYWVARSRGYARTGETTKPIERAPNFGDRPLCNLCRLPMHSGLTCQEARTVINAVPGLGER